MHDCHTTMQVLNKLTQKLLAKDPRHLQQHLPQPSAMSILRTDILIVLKGLCEKTVMRYF
jgi:hypothetical protein